MLATRDRSAARVEVTAAHMRHLIVVEDDALLAADFVGILEEAGHRVVGVARTLEQSLELAVAEHADLALIDIDGPGERESLDIARLLTDRFFVPTIFVGTTISWEFMYDSRYYRPAGFLEKPYTAAGIERLCAHAPVNPLAPAREIAAKPAAALTRREAAG